MTLEEIRERIKSLDFLDNGDQIILALSGGPDSACLFYALNQMKSEFDLSINCVHVNHGLRGKASDADEYFVRSICKKYNCNLRVVSADIKKVASERKLSTEEAGRIVRYQSFYEEAEKVFKETGSSPKILIAHNMDDQAETILFRIIRGTGVTGIKAMQKVEMTDAGFEIIRPLLDVSKRDILKALDTGNFSYCKDNTNELPIYARNKIRLDIIPAMESINPALKEAVIRLGDIAREQEDFLDRKAYECIEALKSEYKIILTQYMSIISADVLRTYHVAIQKRVFSIILKQMGILDNISYKHMESLVELLESENPSIEINLPYGFKACRIYGNVGIFAKEFFSTESPFNMKISTVDNLPENMREREHIKCKDTDKAAQGTSRSTCQSIYRRTCQSTYRSTCQSTFNSTYHQFENSNMHFDVFIAKSVFEKKYGKSKKPVLRYRNPGDYMVLKDGKKKKIKNILVDDKIPRILRTRVPLLAVGSEIIWMGDLTGRSNGRLSGDFQIDSNIDCNKVENNNGENGAEGWFHIEILREM